MAEKRGIKTPAGIRQLRQLAGLYGVQTAYYDVHGRRQSASAESLLAVLQAMAAPIESLADAPAAIDAYAQQLWSTPLEPVLTAWEGKLAGVELRLPDRDDLRLGGELILDRWRAQTPRMARQRPAHDGLGQCRRQPQLRRLKHCRSSARCPMATII